eukprot:2474124-Rhodomonas_salina.1
MSGLKGEERACQDIGQEIGQGIGQDIGQKTRQDTAHGSPVQAKQARGRGTGQSRRRAQPCTLP